MLTGKATLWINKQCLTLTVSTEGTCSAFLATGEEGGGVSIRICPWEPLDDLPAPEQPMGSWKLSEED